MMAGEQFGGGVDDAQRSAELVADHADEAGLEEIELALGIQGDAEIFLAGAPAPRCGSATRSSRISLRRRMVSSASLSSVMSWWMTTTSCNTPSGVMTG